MLLFLFETELIGMAQNNIQGLSLQNLELAVARSIENAEEAY